MQRTMKCKHSDPLCAPCKRELDAMYPTEHQADMDSVNLSLKSLYKLVDIDLQWIEHFSDLFGDQMSDRSQDNLANRIGTLRKLKADIWEKM